MKLAIPFVLLTLGFTHAAHAQHGFDLAAGDCWKGVSYCSFNSCDSNTGHALTLYATVRPPMDMPQVVGMEAILDVAVAATTLPSWWRLDSGGCRAGALVLSPQTESPGCTDFWDGTALGLTTAQLLPAGEFGERIRIHVAIAAATSQAMAAGEERAMFRLAIPRTRSTGAGACPGCAVGACVALESMTLVQPSGVGDLQLVQAHENPWVVHNGGLFAGPGLTVAPCAIGCVVPTRSRTWGQIKSQYR